MSLDELNALLDEIAEEERERAIDVIYQEFLDEMYALFEMEQYAEDCADLDAEYYGVM